MATLAKEPGFQGLRVHARSLQHRGGPGTTVAAGTLALDAPPVLAWVDAPDDDTSAYLLPFPQPDAPLTAQQQAAVQALSAAAAAAGGMLPGSRLGCWAAAPGLPGGPRLLEEIRRSMVPGAIAVNARLRGIFVQATGGVGGLESPLKFPPPLKLQRPAAAASAAAAAAGSSSGGTGAAGRGSGILGIGRGLVGGARNQEQHCFAPRERRLGRLLIVLPWPHRGGAATLSVPPPSLPEAKPGDSSYWAERVAEKRKRQAETMAAAGCGDMIPLAKIPAGGASSGHETAAAAAAEKTQDEEKGEGEEEAGGGGEASGSSKRRRMGEEEQHAAAAPAAAEVPQLPPAAAVKLQWFAFADGVSLGADAVDGPVTDGHRLTLLYDISSIDAPPLPQEPRRGFGGFGGQLEDERRRAEDEKEADLYENGPPPRMLLAAAAAASPLAARLRELLSSAAWHPMGATLGLMCPGAGGVGGALGRAAKDKAISADAFPEILAGAPRLLWAAAAATGLRPRAVPAVLAPSGASIAAWNAFAKEAHKKHGCGSMRPPWHADWLRVAGASSGAEDAQAAPGEATHELPPCSVLLSNAGLGEVVQKIRSQVVSFGWGHEPSKLSAVPSQAAANDKAVSSIVGGARRATDGPWPVLWLEPLRDRAFVAIGELPCKVPQAQAAAHMRDLDRGFFAAPPAPPKWTLRAGVAVLVDVPAWGSAERVAAIAAAGGVAGGSV